MVTKNDARTPASRKASSSLGTPSSSPRRVSTSTRNARRRSGPPATTSPPFERRLRRRNSLGPASPRKTVGGRRGERRRSPRLGSIAFEPFDRTRQPVLERGLGAHPQELVHP